MIDKPVCIDAADGSVEWLTVGQAEGLIGELQSELEALKATVVALRGELDLTQKHAIKVWAEQGTELAELRAENERLKVGGNCKHWCPDVHPHCCGLSPDADCGPSYHCIFIPARWEAQP